MGMEGQWRVYRDECLVGKVPDDLIPLFRDVFFLGAHGATWLLNHYAQPQFSEAQTEQANKELFNELARFGKEYRDRHEP